MARIMSERWVVSNVILKVYDEAECPICKQVDEVSEDAYFHQASMLEEVQARHWSLLTCHRCKMQYVYKTEYADKERAK